MLRVCSALVLVPLAIGTAYLGGWPFALFWGAAALGVLWEWISLVAPSEERFMLLTGGAALALAVALAGMGHAWAAVVVLAMGALGAAARALGGPKLVPQVSPNKTWAGAVGGLLGAILVAVAIAKLAALSAVFTLAMVALALSVVAQAGDLFESFLKRRFSAKDSSHLIPGHGGLMDRLDGFVTASAAAALIGFLRGGFEAPGRGLLVW
ncbi:MAG: CDP-archaeol synthase [Alphaproteobacteria bacterium]|nr:MAG: CDP-archaeol synthase [Alphaproteobacteria bacterium]